MAEEIRKRVAETWNVLAQLEIEHTSIPGGLDENELEVAEGQIGRRLPEAYRVSISLHGAEDYGFEMRGPRLSAGRQQ